MNDRSGELYKWAASLSFNIKALFWLITIVSFSTFSITLYIAFNVCDQDVNRKFFSLALVGDIFPIIFGFFWIVVAIPSISKGLYYLKKDRPKTYVVALLLTFIVVSVVSSRLRTHADFHRRNFCGPARSI